MTYRQRAALNDAGFITAITDPITEVFRRQVTVPVALTQVLDTSSPSSPNFSKVFPLLVPVVS